MMFLGLILFCFIMFVIFLLPDSLNFLSVSIGGNLLVILEPD